MGADRTPTPLRCAGFSQDELLAWHWKWEPGLLRVAQLVTTEVRAKHIEALSMCNPRPVESAEGSHLDPKNR